VEIKIGIQHVARELTVETEATGAEVETDLRKALADGTMLAITDEKGRRVLVRLRHRLIRVRLSTPARTGLPAPRVRAGSPSGWVRVASRRP